MGIGQSRRSDVTAEENAERWRHTWHWDSPQELEFTRVGAPGRQMAGGVVPTDYARRIREITVRNAGAIDYVVRLYANTTCKLSFTVPANTTRVWPSEDGREVPAGTSAWIEIGDVVGPTFYTIGSTVFVSVAGLEASNV